MKQSYLFLEWINNNFKLNVYDGISIISLSMESMVIIVLRI